MATFKARARTLDLLGRQQIAGIPTAISELFKNAHDAYADNVEVDYYKSDQLFILRDNGFGMTQDEFLDRWLTLGIESRTSSRSLPIDSNKPKRIIMGEKGIGRLAIASIGPQVLVLTRAKGRDKLSDLIVAFVNWKLFEIPSIDLQDINVPMKIFSGGKLPDKKDIENLVEEVISNVKELMSKNKISNQIAKEIIQQVREFDINPDEIDKYLKIPSLKSGGGVHFYIKPVYETLQMDIEGEEFGKKATPLTKMLIGFTNTMIPKTASPKIKTAFRYHETDDDSVDLINEQEFFTPEEFRSADHHFTGEFDEYGQFKGTVIVYGEKTYEHAIHWKKARKEKTMCRSFKINIAYVQGTQSQSRIPPEEWARISEKCDKLGGLYIYRNGIRILPYGDSDYDYLDIEQRRTLHAGHHFFSYRRMFGVIEISKEKNDQLIEKAGREGFIENKAYRQFRNILINFFVQLAADFFREKAEISDFWSERRSHLEKVKTARKKRDKKAKKNRKRFIKKIEKIINSIEKKEPDIQVNELLETVEEELTSLFAEDEKKSIGKIITLENKIREKLEQIGKKYWIKLPRNLAVSEEIEGFYDIYLQTYDKLKSGLFLPASKKIDELIDKKTEEINLKFDPRARINKTLMDLIEREEEQLNSANNGLSESLDKANQNINSLQDEITSEINLLQNKITDELQKIPNKKLKDKNEFILIRDQLESKVISKIEHLIDILETISFQLDKITWSKVKGGEIISEADITASLEQDILSLKEKEDLDLELIQLGMALGVIHHEFTGTAKSIRRNIRRLKAWSDINEDLQPIYNNLRSNFEHLDGYLTLFTPLSRRLYRKEVDITGNGIKQFLEDVFEEKFEKLDIDFIPTKAFLNKKIVGYPSTFYPVFINLIDNATFWLKESSKPRKIVLDADEKGYFISNNGPPISKIDHDIIFKYSFSRKPIGRGMGLYISKEVLSKVGYKIYVSPSKLGKGVTFRIEKIENNNGGE